MRTARCRGEGVARVGGATMASVASLHARHRVVRGLVLALPIVIIVVFMAAVVIFAHTA